MGKGTPARRGGKIVHIICRRCGRHSYHRRRRSARRAGSATPRAGAATSGRSCASLRPAGRPRPRHPTVPLERVAQPPPGGPAQADPRADQDGLGPRAGGEEEASRPEHVRPVVLEPDPEAPAEPAGSRRRERTGRPRLAGPEEHRFAPARDEVRADDLVDPVDVERPRRAEHRTVARRGAPIGVVRRVARDVRLGLDQTDRPRPVRRADTELHSEEVAGDAHGRSVEEGTADRRRGVTPRGPCRDRRAVGHRPRPSPPRS